MMRGAAAIGIGHAELAVGAGRDAHVPTHMARRRCLRIESEWHLPVRGGLIGANVEHDAIDHVVGMPVDNGSHGAEPLPTGGKMLPNGLRGTVVGKPDWQRIRYCVRKSSVRALYTRNGGVVS
jgi:hypothetical protein